MPSKVQLFGPDDKNTTIWSPGSEQNPDGCAIVYSSLFVEGYFYKTCPTGFSSNQLYLSLPAGFVSSTISQDDATQAARELLAARGAELAEANGTCTLGEFQEVFAHVDSTYNWDWVADRATLFPREVKNTIPDGSGYGTGTDAGIIVQFPVGNSLAWPLMVGFFYSGTTLFLAENTQRIAPTEALRLDIEDTYGLMHMDFRTLHHADYPNLTVYAGKNSNENADIPEASEYVQHVTSQYMGKLVADFGSREIYGPAWNEDQDGPSDNTLNPEPNPNEIREFTIASLGGFLFRIDTASRSIINGKLAGVYLVCYKEDIQVYKYDAGTTNYESLYTIPYNPKNKTTYFACSILFDGVNKSAEIYIDGVFELSIPDNTLTNIHLPICYQRGVFSVDHWIGDITSGVIYPGTNRLPPPVTTRYFEPTDILNPEAQSPEDPLLKILFPATIEGAETLLEANKPFPKLAAGPVGTGFSKELMDANSLVGAWWGGAFFGQAINLLVNFDTSQYPELGAILWGSYAIQVGKIEMNRYSDVPNIPSNPYKFLMTGYQIYPIIPKEDIPGIDWAEYDLFKTWWQAYNQAPRWSCSWDSVFQPSELFSSAEEPAIESGNATRFKELTLDEIPVLQAGSYKQVANQVGDGWLYTTSLLSLAPGRVFSDTNTGEFKDILTKSDINNHYYFFTEGWFDIQTITDVFSGIRSVKLMTGVQGKRTSEVLEPPAYDFRYSCPVPPTFPPVIDVRIPCVERVFEVTGTFQAITGGMELIVEDYKDCLFGDPYGSVCYPSRKTWSRGFGFVPELFIVPVNGPTLQLLLRPIIPEYVHLGTKLLDKLFVEFPVLDFSIVKDGWPGVIFSESVGLSVGSTINPAADEVAYSTIMEACYFVDPFTQAWYFYNSPDERLEGLLTVGDRCKFTFRLPFI